MLLNLNLRKAILRGCIECLSKRFMLQFIRFVDDFRAFLEIYCLLNFLILKSLLHHEVRWYLIEHIELFDVFILPLLLLLFIPFFGVFLKLLRHNDRLSDTWDVGGGSLHHRHILNLFQILDTLSLVHQHYILILIVVRERTTGVKHVLHDWRLWICSLYLLLRILVVKFNLFVRELARLLLYFWVFIRFWGVVWLFCWLVILSDDMLELRRHF